MTAMAYAFVKTGGSLDAAEVERADADVVDVMLSWGDGADRTVLAVKHLRAGETLTIGEGEDCDFLVPERVLGVPQARVLSRVGDNVVLAAPAGSKLRVDGWGRSEASFYLVKGRVAEIEIGGFSLRFSVVAAPKNVAGAIETSGSTLGSVAGSMLLHGALIAAASFFAMHMNASDADQAERDATHMMQVSLDAPADVEAQKDLTPDDPSGGAKASDSPAADSPAGHIGKPDSRVALGRMTVQGDPSKAKSLSREQQIQDAQSYGIAGLLGVINASLGGSGPSSPWGHDTTNGADDATVMGNMFSGMPNEAMGSGGLTLSGIGEAGAGPGSWIGMGHIGDGSLGNCINGGKCDGPEGIGIGRNPNREMHKVGAPHMGPPAVSVSGRLPAEVIQRVVRLYSGRILSCYQSGVQANPSLSGRVGVVFVIDRSGAVSFAQDAGSDLPDAGVRQCVVSAFPQMSFPAPEGGIVKVSYGFSFSPDTGV